MLLQLERRPAACIVIRPLAECNVLSAPSVFTARRYAMSDYAMVALCLCVCSSQVAAEPITVVCKAARVVRGLNNGVMALFERFTVCSAKMAESIDGKASNRLRYTLSVQCIRCILIIQPHYRANSYYENYNFHHSVCIEIKRKRGNVTFQTVTAC